eukprot:3834055-Rhodomonas_salina.2
MVPCYARDSGSAYGAIGLRDCYAMPGTDLAYAATRCTVAWLARTAGHYPPTRCACTGIAYAAILLRAVLVLA